MAEYLVLPSFHPPMATVTFSLGNAYLRSVAFLKPARP
jgi:hypothetical protein